MSVMCVTSLQHSQLSSQPFLSLLSSCRNEGSERDGLTRQCWQKAEWHRNKLIEFEKSAFFTGKPVPPYVSASFWHNAQNSNLFHDSWSFGSLEMYAFGKKFMTSICFCHVPLNLFFISISNTKSSF